MQCDIAIIGSGFGGSLTALVLHQLGWKVALFDRSHHPRFAIGESSTPLANASLERIARDFHLPWLKPFAKYGTWKRAYPEIVVGLKRGFSYFRHELGQHWKPDPGHRNELLVAASSSDEDSDTHWLRSEFDHHIAQRVREAQIPFQEDVIVQLKQGHPGWIVDSQPGMKQPHSVGASAAQTWQARFVIDASGEGQVVPRTLGVGQHPRGLQTHSRGLFSHFRDVELWEEVAQKAGRNSTGAPYPSDAAALHHVFDGGWMWNLRFDNGVVSAGFALDPRLHPIPDCSPDEEWKIWMERYPSIGEQYQSAVPIRPIVRTGRMQRRGAQGAGPGWLALPTTVAFLDPLHSSGNAHTLYHIEKIGRLFGNFPQLPQPEELEEYSSLLQDEVDLIDEIVHGGFLLFPHFEDFVPYSMSYFIAATWSEHLRREGKETSGFLSARETDLRGIISELYQSIRSQTEEGFSGFQPSVSGLLPPTNRNFSVPSKGNLFNSAACLFQPYNRAGLLRPDATNWYPYLTNCE